MIRDGQIKRGDYLLPHQAQAICRDLHGEKIAKNFGGKSGAYRLTEEQKAELTPGTISRKWRYEFLIYTPESFATSWTAFDDREAMQRFLDAYALTLDHEPAPGDQFWVHMPADNSGWLPITLPETNDLYQGGVRTWTNAGRALCDPAEVDKGRVLIADDELGLRSAVVGGINALAWIDIVDGMELPFMQGEGIKTLIRELRIPKVDRIAFESHHRMWDEPYALYGIQGNYRNGRARIYAVDRGSDTIVVASDFYPTAEQERTA